MDGKWTSGDLDAHLAESGKPGDGNMTISRNDPDTARKKPKVSMDTCPNEGGMLAQRRRGRREKCKYDNIKNP
jgi:hypothetical protein